MAAMQRPADILIVRLAIDLVRHASARCRR
jgi:hypothetical protein